MTGRHHSRTWLAVSDSTGDFLGALFDWLDLKYTAAIFNWPEGARWIHVETGETVTYTQGRLIVSPPVCQPDPSLSGG